jgi:hypothetical protein
MSGYCVNNTGIPNDGFTMFVYRLLVHVSSTYQQVQRILHPVGAAITTATAQINNQAKQHSSYQAQHESTANPLATAK